MRHLFAIALAGAALACATPASAADCGKDWKRAAFHALNVADKLVTHEATSSGRAREANPVLRALTGEKVSLGGAAIAAGIVSAIHEVGYALARRDGCRAAKRFQNVSLIAQAGITAWTVGVRLSF